MSNNSPSRAKHECEHVNKACRGSTVRVGSRNVAGFASVETGASHTASKEHSDSLADGTPVSVLVSKHGLNMDILRFVLTACIVDRYDRV
jgi:hypothetical protein